MSTFAQKIQKTDCLAKIFEKIGFSLWQLQELEGAAAMYFVLLAQASKGMGAEAGQSLVDKAKNRTFGATIHRLANAGLLNTHIESRFTALLRERNWLVHSSRATNRNASHVESVATALLARLDAIAEEAFSLTKEIGLLVDAFAETNGVANEHISRDTNRLLEQWHSSGESETGN